MNYIIQALSFIILISSFGIEAKQNQFDSEFLNSFVNNIKETAQLPSGTAVAVVYEDKIIYEGYWGYRNIQEGLKTDADTRFYIASVTKPFLALNHLLDASSNTTLQSTTLEAMFPELILPGRENIVAKDLLTHTASINNLPLVLATAFSGEHTAQSIEQLVIQESSLSKEAVGEFKYTNVGYNIYSVFADRYFKQSWQEKLQNQIFEPAKMLSTSAKSSHIKDKSRIAKPYSLTNPKSSEALYLEKQDSTMHAAGGMYATSKNLGRFLIAQLNQGYIDGKGVFPSEVIAKSHTQQVTTDTAFLDFKRDGYAWGWYTGDYKNQRMLHHFGGFAGAHAHVSFMPEKKIGLVILNNEDFLSSRLTSVIADYVYGSLLQETGIKESIAQRIASLKGKLSAIDTMLANQQNKLNKREFLLSLPKENYVGEYTHRLLGTMTVKLNIEGRFDVTWGVMHSRSTGMDKVEQIRVQMEPTSGTVIRFDVTENVNSLSYGGIVFNKTVENKL
ncbi:serine hydrolase domain-containing protein [Pseudoalteromonas sp. Ld20]|uniref:serine hydrolase domain-containing protein n=1 Tax=Pseudoalteromonas sp. Ld20 TaxID=649165 RepID=UPI0038657049